ncbi:MAG: hypothetical protein DELT_02707 [Desulfovibrio sp.]
MDSISGTASQAQGVLKDTTGAQLISKTLDRMNTAQSLTGPKVNADYQFQKDVLSAAGIGTKLDAKV